MKIYIAAKYGRRYELRSLAETLIAAGHEITGDWIWDGEPTGDKAEESASRDIAGVRTADVLLFMGEPQASENRGGGRWFEFGMAFGLRKTCVAWLNYDPTRGGHDHLPLGHESVFTALPDVKIVASYDELVKVLEQEAS